VTFEAMSHALLELGTDPDHVLVGVGEIACAHEPGVLITQALGSCVGVTLWDPRTHVAGMAHVMLPAAPVSGFTGRRHRFADIAIPELLEQLAGHGVGRHRIVAKIAGGSSMFKGESGLDSIGGRNVAAVLAQLESEGVSVSAADTGGSHARTIELRLDSGLLIVRSYSFGMREI
jgi:chemotaxis protein CheD